MHFRQLENDVLEVLKRRQMVRRREHLLDATVVPANMEYPTDAKLLNRARQWVVKAIRVIRRRCDVKGKVRTYCRKAQAAYLGFQKKRKRTKAAVRLMRGKLLRYLRRNIGQLEKLLRGYGERLKDKERKVLEERLRTVKTIYDQQRELWKTRARTVKDRIVSLHLPHIRPIVRGKDGRDVEFGPKVLLSWVDGFGFLDGLKFKAHNEGALWGESLELHKKRFGEIHRGWNIRDTGKPGDAEGEGRAGRGEGSGTFGEHDEKQEVATGETENTRKPDGRDYWPREEPFWVGPNPLHDQRR